MGIIKNYQVKGNCKVTFTFPFSAASGAKTVQVLGDFNNWDSKSAPLMKKGKEEFSSVVELSAGNSYQFKYLLDGSTWENDFAADGYVQTPYQGVSNSVIVLDEVDQPSDSKATKSIKVTKAAANDSATVVVKEVKKASTKKEVAKSPAVEVSTKPVKVSLDAKATKSKNAKSAK